MKGNWGNQPSQENIKSSNTITYLYIKSFKEITPFLFVNGWSHYFHQWKLVALHKHQSRNKANDQKLCTISCGGKDRAELQPPARLGNLNPPLAAPGSTVSRLFVCFRFYGDKRCLWPVSLTSSSCLSCVFGFSETGVSAGVLSPVFKIGQLPTHVTPIDPTLAVFLVFIIN